MNFRYPDSAQCKILSEQLHEYMHGTLLLDQNIVKPLLSGHSQERDNWPLNKGGCLGSPENTVGHGPVFILSNISTNKCNWR